MNTMIGIYEIVNTTNGKRYIGSSVNFYKRTLHHICLLKQGRHHSKHLQASWLKYTKSSFKFNFLVECKAEHLLMYEQLLIDSFKPEYNMCTIAGTCRGIIRGSFSKDHRSKISLAKTGVKLSSEHRENISLGKVGIKQTEEARDKRSKALIGKPWSEKRRLAHNNKQQGIK